MRGTTFAQAASLASTRARPIRAASSSEDVVTSTTISTFGSGMRKFRSFDVHVLTGGHDMARQTEYGPPLLLPPISHPPILHPPILFPLVLLPPLLVLPLVLPPALLPPGLLLDLEEEEALIIQVRQGGLAPIRLYASRLQHPELIPSQVVKRRHCPALLSVGKTQAGQKQHPCLTAIPKLPKEEIKFNWL